MAWINTGGWCCSASAFGRSLIDDPDAATARTTLGLGTLATQASSNVSITGGTIAGLSSLAVTGTSTFNGLVQHQLGVVSTGVGNGSTTGNARGTGANDLATIRNNAAQVASGTYAAIGGGGYNTASGSYATVSGGTVNQATGYGAAVAGGDGNVASGTRAFVGGGWINEATAAAATVGGGFDNTCAAESSVVSGGRTNSISSAGIYSSITGGIYNSVTYLYGRAGGREAASDHLGEDAYSSGSFTSTVGTAQQSHVTWRAETTNATATVMYLDQTISKMTVPADCTYAFTILLVARRTDAANESAAWRIDGCIDRNTNTTALVGTPATTTLGDDSAGAWTFTVTADDTNDCLKITVTGEASKTIRWVAGATFVKVMNG